MRYASLIAIIASCELFSLTIGTEDQCHSDCTSSPRPVGPTRPWDTMDPLGNTLQLTRPYPYHIAANDVDEHRYTFHTFCQLGCTYFYSASASAEAGTKQTTTLGQCRNQCDEKYSFNALTPPYNDLAEVARLECHDGCHMALKRCQPGYYCLQPSFPDDDSTASSSATQYEGGDMIPCPAGTYRDVSYESVSECTPCLPNHYREDVKGRRLSSCSPCPAGTSAVNSGSTSIQQCVRCPAGTFSTEASFCMCITPQACAREQLAPPADAEKRDTVPYIGRW